MALPLFASLEFIYSFLSIFRQSIHKIFKILILYLQERYLFVEISCSWDALFGAAFAEIYSIKCKSRINVLYNAWVMGITSYDQFQEHEEKKSA